MDRKDRLYDNYEDALFALLMDRVAQEEGARLLEENERLKNDPGASVPPELDQKSLDTIRRALAGRGRRRTHTVGWYLSRLAVAILAALLLFVTAYAVSPEVRIWTLETLINSSDVSSHFSILSDEGAKETDGAARQTLAGYALPDISRRYEVVDQGETSRSAWIEYAHADGSAISINISSIHDTFLDNEDLDGSIDVTIHGCPGKLLEKEKEVYLSWYDAENEKAIILYTMGVGSEVALTYADQIIFIG